MKTCLSFAILMLALSVAAQPTIPVRVDLQAPQREFKTRWAAGSTPTLAAYVYDGGAPYTNLAGWTGLVYVAVTPTSGVSVTMSGYSSNKVFFPFAASQSATVGTFDAYVILGNGTNNYQWGEGRFTWTDSPALLGAGPISLAVPFNWDNYTFTGTPPAFPTYFTNPIAGEVTGDPTSTVIAAGVVTTGKLSSQVRGMLIEPDRVSTGDLTSQVRGMLIQPDRVGTNDLTPEVRGLLATGSGINTNSPAWSNLTAQVAGKYDASNPQKYVSSWAQYTAAGSSPTNWVEFDSNFKFAIVIGSSGTNGMVEVLRTPDESGRRGGVLRFSRTQAGSSAIQTQTVFTMGNSDLVVSGAEMNGNIDAAQFNNQLPAFYLNRANHTGAVDATTLGGYLPTDFIISTSLSNYWRITTGAVTSHNATGLRGEYRRNTTNAYFHDGSQWITWSVSTNFSH